MYFQGSWWLAARAVADVVVSLLLLNPEEKLVEEKGPLIQWMTPRLKPILNVRFANKLTRQQKNTITSVLCKFTSCSFSYNVLSLSFFDEREFFLLLYQ